MGTFKDRRRNVLLNKEYSKLIQREDKLLQSKYKSPGVTDKIREKIPAKALAALELAFEKGFLYVFDKGSPIIEKTGSLNKARYNADLSSHALELDLSKRNLKSLDKQISHRYNATRGVITLEGVGLGALGVGIPDIPVLIGLLLKTCYEIAAGYGFDYRNASERVYILALLRLAFADEYQRKQLSIECDKIATAIDCGENINTNITHDDLHSVSAILASDMLLAKFIQGIPLAGAVGGAFNYNFVSKIAKVAAIKYKKRFLSELIDAQNQI